MKRLPLVAASGVAILALVGIGAVPAQATSRPTAKVSITLDEDLPYQAPNQGPRQFAVAGIYVGTGPELTVNDVLPGTSGRWNGALTVDIDPTSHHITITADSSVYYQYTVLKIASSQIRYRSVLSDTLLVAPSSPMHPTIVSTATGMTLTWDAKLADHYFQYANGGTLVLSYKDVTAVSAAGSASSRHVTVRGTVTRFDGSKPTASAKVYEGTHLVGTIGTNGGTKVFAATPGRHVYTVKYAGTTTLQASSKAVAVVVK